MRLSRRHADGGSPCKRVAARLILRVSTRDSSERLFPRARALGWFLPFWLCGCATNTSFTGSTFTAATPGWQGVPVLVADLQRSPAINAAARRMLATRGEEAVPQLVDALRACMAPGRDAGLLRAARLLRALRDLHSSAAMPLCRHILVDGELDGPASERYALMTEALLYIGDFFDQQAARDIYIRYVMENREKYIEKLSYKSHWGNQGQADSLRVDIFSGLSKLVRSGDPRARDVLKYMLRTLTVDAFVSYTVSYLDDNGFDLAIQTQDRLAIRKVLMSDK